MPDPGTGQQTIDKAAERFVAAGLRADDSLFTPGRAVWSAATAAAYLQSGLNRAWEQMAGAHSGEAAGPPGPVQLPADPVAEQG